MKKFTASALLAALLSTTAVAQVNMGNQKGSTDLPFNVTKVADFNLPWKIAFLPDGRMLVTEKVGPIWLVTPTGQKTQVSNVPPVLWLGQGGMLSIYLSPHYATDHYVYLTYSEPHEETVPVPAGGRGPRTAPCPTDTSKVCGSSLAMARARLVLGNGTASLEGLQVLWHDPAGGYGGQFGAQIAFAPDGNSLFLSSGDRQRMTPAQNPDSPLGKILHLTLDGKPAAGNPFAGQSSAQSLAITYPPADTEAAKTATVVRTFTYPASAPNQTRAETWASGFRTPYGMAFGPDGRLWEVEHGPRGGDELNLIERGKNYGWPSVSYGINYNGVAVANYDPANCGIIPAGVVPAATANAPGIAAQQDANQAVCRSAGLNRSPFTRPVIYWVPVVAPGNLMFYKGNAFRGWGGSALISGMDSQSITRVTFDGRGGATAAQRWSMSFKVRDVEEAPDGSLWAVDNANPGGLYHLTPK